MIFSISNDFIRAPTRQPIWSTGAYVGVTGSGKFHITTNLTPCNGQVAPSQVWFDGWIKRAQ